MIEIVFACVVCFLLVFIIYKRTGLCIPGAVKNQHSVDVCLVLLHLVREMQRHRVISVAIHNGEANFRDEMALTEHSLHRSMHSLAEQFGEKHHVFSSPQWQTVQGRWESLRNNWRDLDFVTNLFAHNEVVLGLIGVLQTLADDEPKCLGDNRFQIINHWLPLIEHLGMLRTLGVHTLSQSDPLEESRISLSISDHSQHASQALLQLSKNIPDDSIVSTSESLLRRVLQLTEESATTYSTQTFYDEMTALIDRWYQLITRQVAHQA